MEMIGEFLQAVKVMNLGDNCLFQTVDLYEGQNLAQVKLGY